MSVPISLLFVAFGLSAVATSIFGRNFRRIDYATRQKDLGPMPTWVDKLFFGAVGLLFTSIGVYHLACH